jgi:hypothetical protein
MIKRGIERRERKAHHLFIDVSGSKNTRQVERDVGIESGFKEEHNDREQ